MYSSFCSRKALRCALFPHIKPYVDGYKRYTDIAPSTSKPTKRYLDIAPSKPKTTERYFDLAPSTPTTTSSTSTSRPLQDCDALPRSRALYANASTIRRLPIFPPWVSWRLRVE